MWIMLNDAFFSIVMPPQSWGRGELLVRARRKHDIPRVFGVYGEQAVEYTPNRDYAYRALIPREMVARVIPAQVMGITYGNFKDSVRDHDLHDAYTRVWHDLLPLQGDVGLYASGPRYPRGGGRAGRAQPKAKAQPKSPDPLPEYRMFGADGPVSDLTPGFRPA